MKKLLLFLVFPATLHAQFGNLDNTFDGDGLFTLNESGSYVSVALQEDGKIVAMGNVFNANYDINVVRLNPDGSLDPNFGGIGGETFDFGNNDIPEKMLLQPDGKILICGGSSSPSGGIEYHMFVMRLNPDGSEDPTFGTNGRVFVSFGVSDPSGYAYDMTFLPGGRIMLVGTTFVADGGDIAIAVLNSDGMLDTDFSFDGKLTYDINDIDRAFAVHVQSNGTVTLAGFTTVGGGGQPQGMLVQMNEDGSFVNSFGSVGVSIIDLVGPDERFQDIKMDGAGRFYVCGRHETPGGTRDGVILRTGSNGLLDLNFSFDGIVYTDHTGNNDFISELLIQPDGKIVLAAEAGNVGGSNGVLYRLNEDGVYDNTFGTNGKVVLDDVLGTSFYSVALQPDLKLIAAGRQGPSQMLVARYTTGMNVGVGEVDAFIGSTLIYPNPITDNTVTVEYELTSDEAVSIELFDVSGKQLSNLQAEIREQAGVHQKSLSLPALSAGNYLLRFNAEKGSVTVKVFVN